MKLMRTLTVVLLVLSATACIKSADGGRAQAGSNLKEVVLEVPTIT